MSISLVDSIIQDWDVVTDVNDNNLATNNLIVMIKMGIDIDEFTKLVNIFEASIQTVINYDVLLLECCTDDTWLLNDHIEFLVSRGANVDATGNWKMSCLHYLARCGNIDMIKLFIESGANSFYRDIYFRDIFVCLDLYLEDIGIPKDVYMYYPQIGIHVFEDPSTQKILDDILILKRYIINKHNKQTEISKRIDALQRNCFKNDEDVY